MKPFTLKRKSWHYWLANSGDTYVGTQTTICRYFWLVLYGALYRLCCLLLICLGVACATATVGAMLAGPVAFWFLEHDSRSMWYEVSATGLTVDLVLLTCASCVAVANWRRARAGQNKATKQPGFITLAYRSFKDKTCVKINLE